MQAHTDVVVYAGITENHSDFDNSHEDEHHENDSEDDKNIEHHHHCNSISLINVFLPVENLVNFTNFSQVKITINYYEIPNYHSYLDSVFQPPKKS